MSDDIETYVNSKGKTVSGDWDKYEHYFDPELAMWMVHHTDSEGTDDTYPQE